ncbi:8305_t:CDS:10 [Paraglomus occultum]|uniref:RNA polymerase II subunit A C-terminal domain phosphatase n=1 Tax=Paraglomus occultum TaxID=144539 RepID=A0A9N9B1I6_9GLOM|nr:8305_t:CDS:10 [Paraglomus occultum]
MEGLFEIRLPRAHLPATIRRIHVRPGTEVEKTQPLCTYEHEEVVHQPQFDEEHGTERLLPIASNFTKELKSPVVGVVDQIMVKEGEVIYSEDIDFTGTSDTQRATIELANTAAGLTVTRAEAQRMDMETAERLQKEKKLSLVVDLDLTIIHATVDPTVGEWMEDENNVNHAATKDVHKIQLPDCNVLYYVKLRPGLMDFLNEVRKMYELHIYTMGTRNYALAVANIIDPDKKIFGDRLITRDENGGNIIEKNIKRLFPCDDSMVVVIDDRFDLWKGVPNLIQVRPYEFFQGVGDINASFFPKQLRHPSPSPLPNQPLKIDIPPIDTSDSSAGSLSDNYSSSATTTPISTPTLPFSSSVPDILIEELEQQQQLEEFQHELENQFITRPLAQLEKKQAEQQQQTNKEKEDQITISHEKNGNNEMTSSAPARSVLNDNDEELGIILERLKTVHKRYYDTFDAKTEENEQQEGEQAKRADVKVILNEMRSQVLKGVKILFTRLIRTTLNEKQSADIWRRAESFGAVCTEDWDGVTHLVAGDPGTDKVKLARRRYKNIKIVAKEWLFDSLSCWQRQPEERYLIPPPSPSFIMSSSSSPSSSPLPSLPSVPNTESKGNDTETDHPNVADEEDEGMLTGTDDSVRPRVGLDTVFETYKKTNWSQVMLEVFDEVGESGDTRLKRQGINLTSNSSGTYPTKRMKHSPLRNPVTSIRKLMGPVRKRRRHYSDEIGEERLSRGIHSDGEADGYGSDGGNESDEGSEFDDDDDENNYSEFNDNNDGYADEKKRRRADDFVMSHNIDDGNGSSNNMEEDVGDEEDDIEDFLAAAMKEEPFDDYSIGSNYSDGYGDGAEYGDYYERVSD